MEELSFRGIENDHFSFCHNLKYEIDQKSAGPRLLSLRLVTVVGRGDFQIEKSNEGWSHRHRSG